MPGALRYAIPKVAYLIWHGKGKKKIKLLLFHHLTPLDKAGGSLHYIGIGFAMLLSEASTMPRQQATKQVGVRIPKEYFATIQTVAEIKGQDNSTVINELIFEAMPRMQAWLADQLGVRMLAFRLALGSIAPRLSPLEAKVLESFARMIPERRADADVPEEKQQRLRRVLQALFEPSPFSKGKDSVTDEKAAEFLLQMVNLEEDLYRRLGANHGTKVVAEFKPNGEPLPGPLSPANFSL
ncbi:MAG: hypothetical protein ACKO23_13280 [Gemmataceae bacterium]